MILGDRPPNPILLAKTTGRMKFGFNEKKDNRQCLSDTPRWSMKKTNIKNTRPYKMAKLFNKKNFFWQDTSSRTCSIIISILLMQSIRNLQ